MDLWVVSFNLLLCCTVRLKKEWFKSSSRIMEIFNPLYYFKRWLYISRCIRQSFMPRWFQITGKENGKTLKESLLSTAISKCQVKVRFQLFMLSVKARPLISSHTDSKCCSPFNPQFNDQWNTNGTARTLLNLRLIKLSGIDPWLCSHGAKRSLSTPAGTNVFQWPYLLGDI